MRRTLLATAATLAALAPLAAPGRAFAAPDDPSATASPPAGATGPAPLVPGSVIASLTADAPIAAGGGWLLWSVPAPGGWALEGSHAGVTRPLAAAPRPQPFDLSVGTSAAGAPVVTFSRCAKTPLPASFPLGLIAPNTGAGCRLRVLDLQSGRESAPAVPHPAGTSDTTPAMWRGRVAFARLDPAHHGQVQQVLLWTPGHRRLASLPHGALPPPCAGRRCPAETRAGLVEGLAYDGRLVTFLWEPVASRVIGHAGWEVRADNVRTGASRLLGAGFAGEVCTGGADLSAPAPPVLDGLTVRFASLQSTCYVFRSVLSQVNTAARDNGSFGILDGVVLGLAEDGATLYALAAPRPKDETNPTCTSSAPCQIVEIASPPLSPEPHRPTPPFF
ncbi:MAG: hypothetical protein QOF77_272 [Solirubrobacteraceae bacterium]|nr:hypothetical protein [Solirubrobacteraceae bacterium]